MKTNDWDHPDLKGHDWVKALPEPGKGARGCRTYHEYDGFNWVCSRPKDHEGQHVATAGTRDGYEDVCVVWRA